MPRLEVETVTDLKVLFEIGALTPDMSVELSKILLGNAAHPSNRGGGSRQVQEDAVMGANKNDAQREGTDKGGLGKEVPSPPSKAGGGNKASVVKPAS